MYLPGIYRPAPFRAGCRMLLSPGSFLYGREFLCNAGDSIHRTAEKGGVLGNPVLVSGPPTIETSSGVYESPLVRWGMHAQD